MSSSLFLALKMSKAIFLEGEPGVGKTEAAKVLSEAFDAELIRLQCYEGLETVKRLIQEMRWQMSTRRTRRWLADPGGNSIHLRRVMRSAAKYGGAPLDLSWRSRRNKQRPFILIADISGSMEKYARLILQFFFSVSQSLRDVECFVFGTRLTRITLQLRLGNIDRAISEATHQVMDWSGGMTAALPFVDDFLPVHNLQSLSALSQHLSRLGPRRSPTNLYQWSPHELTHSGKK